MSLFTAQIFNGLLSGFVGRFQQQSDGSVSPRHVIEVDGSAVGTAGGEVSLPVSGVFWQAVQPVVQSGSTGTDYSANKSTITIPNVGAAFGASGPYANYVLLTTIPASATRANIDIENISGGQIVLVRDDGTAAAASAPNNASAFALAGGAGVGSQGGSWSSATFKGRLQIYAPSSSAIVSVMVD